MRADLHIHSTVSDGMMAPEEILAVAAERGLGAVSITDHDTDEAHKILTPLERADTPILIPGAELDTDFEGIVAEILIYGHRPGEGPLGDMLREIASRRKRRCEIVWTSVRRALGAELPPLDSLYPPPRQIATRPQMARCLFDSGLAPHFEGALEIVAAYDPGIGPPGAGEAIAAAAESGGLAVLAHPLQYEGINLAHLVGELSRCGLAGIELEYPYRDAEVKARQGEIQKLASDHRLFTTSGSNAHFPEDIGNCRGALPGPLMDRISGV